MYSVLFVCLGNICRSPTAEGMLVRRLEQAGLSGKVHVESAGMHGFHEGSPPDPRAVKAADARGYSLEGQLARQVRADDFTRFDLILAMDTSHLTALERLQSAGTTAEIRLLLDFADNPPLGEVPDPYYGGREGFEYALDLIEMGVDGLMRHVTKICGTKI